MSSASPEPDSAVELAWQALDKSWDSPEAHRRFLALCASQGALHEAGSRYRQIRDQRGERSAEAELRLRDVLSSALAQMSLEKAPRPRRSRRLMWLIVGACGFVVLRAVLALLQAGSR